MKKHSKESLTQLLNTELTSDLALQIGDSQGFCPLVLRSLELESHDFPEALRARELFSTPPSDASTGTNMVPYPVDSLQSLTGELVWVKA